MFPDYNFKVPTSMVVGAMSKRVRATIHKFPKDPNI